MDVREVLDLRQRQAARHAHALREPEDRRLVEDRVEHAARAERRVQPGRRVVDAALPRDILAEHERVRVRGEQVGQRLRDAEREVPRPRLVLRQLAAEHLRARRGVGDARREVRGAGQPQRCRDRGDRRQLRPPVRLVRRAPQPPVRVVVQREQRVALDRAGAQQQVHEREQRVARLVRVDRLGRQVVRFDVAAGVPHQPHRLQVHERRPPLRAHERGRRERRRPHAGHVLAVAREVPQPGAVRPVRCSIMRATNVSGVRTEMPMPLSSHTNSTGHGCACSVAAPAAWKPACAVAWLNDASPKLQ
jgi:hypothetical protein